MKYNTTYQHEFIIWPINFGCGNIFSRWSFLAPSSFFARARVLHHQRWGTSAIHRYTIIILFVRSTVRGSAINHSALLGLTSRHRAIQYPPTTIPTPPFTGNRSIVGYRVLREHVFGRLLCKIYSTQI